MQAYFAKLFSGIRVIFPLKKNAYRILFSLHNRAEVVHLLTYTHLPQQQQDSHFKLFSCVWSSNDFNDFTAADRSALDQ